MFKKYSNLALLAKGIARNGLVKMELIEYEKNKIEIE